ncbi:MAG: hypothetical protein KME30_00180 [Iphinoe sp. HA4291-MV1]|jgi:hypothetical protein|nr:hypothetical protein [Iphinoe sp. HA4291-MV1]
MSHIRLGIHLNIIFLSLYKFLLGKTLSKTKKLQSKTYDYTQYVNGHDYVFESVDNQTKGYMTGQGRGIKRGDYIILCDGSNAIRYQIEEIDYYSDPPDMWIALLQEVDFE